MNEEFKNTATEIFKLIEKGEINIAKKLFEKFENRYKTEIEDSNSPLHDALPFYISVLEFLYTPNAINYGTTSKSIIKNHLMNDILE